MKNKKSDKTLKIITDYEFKLNIKALNINSFIAFIGLVRMDTKLGHKALRFSSSTRNGQSFIQWKKRKHRSEEFLLEEKSIIIFMLCIKSNWIRK